MYPATRLVAVAATTAMLAIPATAAAHDRAKPRSVKSHTAKARTALDRAVELAGSDQAAAAVAYARSRAHTLAADREARALADRAPQRRSSARSVRRVARLHDGNLDTFLELAPDASGDMAVTVAKAVLASVKGRERAAAALEALNEHLPEQARPAVARALARIGAGGDEEVAEIADLLGMASIPEAARPWLEQALGLATSAVADAVDRLESLVATLPPEAQPHVSAALVRVEEALATVTALLQGLLDGSAGGGLPVPIDLPILSGLPIPGGLPIPFGLGD